MQTLFPGSSRPLFPKGPSLVAPTVALCLASALLMLADSRMAWADRLRHGIGSLLHPVVVLADVPQRIGRAFERLSGIDALARRNAELEQALLRQSARLNRLAALEAENARLRELLSSSRRLPGRVLVGEVITINQDPYRHQIVINRGSVDGVQPGQPVIDAHGVLGQVVRVHARSATVMLVTDPNHSTPVEVNRTGLQTIARGRGEGGGLSLPFLPANADVRVGDLLVSSSLGGRFPAGYPVGEVAEVRYRTGDHFKEAIAWPTARILRGRQVLLVFEASGQEPDDAAAPPPDAPSAPEPR